MNSLNFLKRFVLNEVNYFIVRDQYDLFFLRRGLGIQSCATLLVTGHYIVLESVRTASSILVFFLIKG